jgi:hypothetical protein
MKQWIQQKNFEKMFMNQQQMFENHYEKVEQKL